MTHLTSFVQQPNYIPITLCKRQLAQWHFSGAYIVDQNPNLYNLNLRDVYIHDAQEVILLANSVVGLDKLQMS